MITIPRYYYLGEPNDTMRDPRRLYVAQSIMEVWGRFSTINAPQTLTLLMWGHDFQLLAAKNIYKELKDHEEWYRRELRGIEDKFGFEDETRHTPGLIQTLIIARKLHIQELNEIAKIKLEQIALKALKGQNQ